MTITFPKFPNRRHPTPIPAPAQNEAVPSDSYSQHAPSATPIGEPLASDIPASQPNVSITPEQLAELKQQLLTTPKPKKSKLLPILAGVLGIAALGAVAYPMYQNMMEEKAIAATPAVIPKSTVATKPASTPSASANIPASTPATAVVTAPATPPAQATPEPTSPPAKAEDLQKPLLVDNAQPTSQKTPSSTETPTAIDSKVETKTEVKTTSEVKPDSKAEGKSDNASSQTPAAKSSSNKGGMSYDEFIKTSDSTVFIEAPAKQK